ncbi:capsular biosynthesis protein, partial [Campylobacter jejuni]|nr:capsular biosynthesis protein [Campylobacter jejuni]
LIIIKNDTWLDFGLITSYFHSKKAVSTQNEILNNIDYFKWLYKKSSSWQEKIKAEINWYDSLPKELFTYTPKIITYEDSYDI